MKRLRSILFISLFTFILGACQPSPVEESNNEPRENLDAESELDDANKSLVVYFSQPETDNPNNMSEDEANSVVVIDGQVFGNTQYIAMLIQEYTDADIFHIEPSTPYTTNHDDLVNIATEERNSNARPEISETIERFDEYDTIFVGYPIWWSDMPMIMYTFFDVYDFSEKTIIPFSTHGGSGLADTITSIREQEPNADLIGNAFSISRDSAENAESDVLDWLRELNMISD